MTSRSSEYSFVNAEPEHTCAYLWHPVLNAIRNNAPGATRVLDLGCGNGAFAAFLSDEGYSVVGVDPSREGIRHAQDTHARPAFFLGSAYDNLADEHGQFPVVTSLEVIEHVYDPRTFARCVYDLLEVEGTAIISTPYHGYWKNLVLSLSGKMDKHFTALWDHGHIKFWSVRTLRQLLEETGFGDITFLRVGRIPVLAKSMIAIATK